MNQLLSASDLSKDELDDIFRMAQRGFNRCLKGKILANLFFEPSTRTQASFESAMKRLGGEVLVLPVNSSLKKGESEEDTVKTMSYYSDIMVIRHSQNNRVEELSRYSAVPVINAGDGNHEHPTQALLDLHTIYENNAHIDHLKILFTGDLVYSRTVPSLITLLRTFNKWKLEITFANEPSIYIKSITEPIGFKVIPEEIIPNFLQKVDILYMTRPQMERHGENSITTNFIMNNALANTMKKNALIMHPLPRTKELDPDVDINPRAKYWEQTKNGLLIRKAILRKILIGC